MIKIFNSNSHIKADSYLLLTTLIWGASFSLVKAALEDISSMLLLSIRFWAGTLFLMPVYLLQKERYVTKIQLRNGVILGLVMFLGMTFQTVGLKYTTASKSGFITGIAVIFVPFLVIMIEKKVPKLNAFISALFAGLGVFLLTQPQAGVINKGDVYTFFCAIVFALQIVLIKHFVKENESLIMAILMLGFCALFSSVATVFIENTYIFFSKELLLSIAFLSVFCTSICFWMQTTWQPKTSATTAAVIFTMEPVFAAVFAFIFLNEFFQLTGWIGALMILSGMFISELGK